MNIDVLAVGRLKSGAEAGLVADYLSRFAKVGRSIGLPPVNQIEVDDRRGGGPAAEAILLRRAIPQPSVLITLDEKGEPLTSPDFAARLQEHRDSAQNLCFVIGGASGIDPDLLREAQWSLSFGRMVWPHLLARVMLSEQLYRAATILAGSPYHRA